jgi:hypothetical protein
MSNICFSSGIRLYARWASGRAACAATAYDVDKDNNDENGRGSNNEAELEMTKRKIIFEVRRLVLFKVPYKRKGNGLLCHIPPYNVYSRMRTGEPKRGDGNGTAD